MFSRCSKFFSIYSKILRLGYINEEKCLHCLNWDITKLWEYSKINEIGMIFVKGERLYERLYMSILPWLLSRWFLQLLIRLLVLPSHFLQSAKCLSLFYSWLENNADGKPMYPMYLCMKTYVLPFQQNIIFYY